MTGLRAGKDEMIYSPAENRYETMPYRRCGRSGLRLPAVSLGLWHNFGSVDVYENARKMAQTAFDLGITHFDLANNYGPEPGSAEITFGRILRPTATNSSSPARRATTCGRDPTGSGDRARI